MTTSAPGTVAGRRLAVLTVLLGGLTAFGPLSMDLYLPAFPRLAADLGATQAQVQLTLTADVLGLVAGQLVLGPLSDAWGRRRLLLGSTALCALASLLCALAPTVGALTVWRFVQGFAGGGGIVLARAVAADLTTGVAAARLFSLFMTLSSGAPIIAPVIGGALLAWTGDWRVVFHLLAVLNAVLAVAVWRAIPETLPEERRHRGGLRQTGRAFAALVRDRAFLGYALTVALAYAALFGYISGSSFALQQHYGLSASAFSAVFALNAAGMVLLGLANARLVARFAVRRLLVLGLSVSAVAAVVLVLGVTAGAGLGLLAVLPPLFVVITTRGLVASNATVLGVQRGASAAGSASAVLGACMFGGGILVTPLVGLGPEGSPVPMALVVAGGALAALLATVVLTRSTTEPVAAIR
ncbi:multidrug effflux MFS transporter [Geodermatophilus ruber]|uniref:MFS transporter, DHA1 family, bicyclomycin/chloramphenicol resistance protein n=1 Tax=Geodermatophilus ruber TaxID=504800 RepID=A0A1I4IV28_9ACTN|nr:multidrug effflux MFS transporter [Geodermatophilus ruber]SFL57711.1 MFS transporter, DHA1 family, bicyclomycin/chloramphenicol resistance protein [Geodermatophilus ruber]